MPAVTPLTKEYGYRSGRLLVAWDSSQSGNAAFRWLVTDQIGSTRMEADLSGSLTTVKRHDYLPFGEELQATTGAQRNGIGYEPPASNVRQKFGSKQRDNETGLDFFEARYYGSAQGRFTSPDEFTGGPTELFAEVAAHNPTFYAEIAEPQSLNKYAYCLNNPFRFIDPDGHQTVPADALKLLLHPNTLSLEIGAAKSLSNSVIEIGNIGRGIRNQEEVELYKPNNSWEELGMEITDHVTLIGGFLGGKGAVGVVTADAKETAAVTASVSKVKTYQVYTMEHPVTSEIYGGRTSGTGTPQQNVAKRTGSSHARTAEGFGPGKLDKSSTNPAAIRGREQLIIEKNRQQGIAAKQINGVDPKNPKWQYYRDSAIKEFGKP